jgi:hypothetical protein
MRQAIPVRRSHAALCALILSGAATMAGCTGTPSKSENPARSPTSASPSVDAVGQNRLLTMAKSQVQTSAHARSWGNDWLTKPEENQDAKAPIGKYRFELVCVSTATGTQAVSAVVWSGSVRKTMSVPCAPAGGRNYVDIVTTSKGLTTNVAPTHGPVAVAYQVTQM